MRLSKSPLRVIAICVIILFTYLSYNEQTVQEIFQDQKQNSSQEQEDLGNCFKKEQELNKDTKQGVSICFENNLEEISYQYYTISPYGEKKSGLIDKDSFREFFVSQDIQEEVEKNKFTQFSTNPSKNTAEEQNQGKVKGVNNYTDQDINRAINEIKLKVLKDLEKNE